MIDDEVLRRTYPAYGGVEGLDPHVRQTAQTQASGRAAPGRPANLLLLRDWHSTKGAIVRCEPNGDYLDLLDAGLAVPADAEFSRARGGNLLLLRDVMMPKGWCVTVDAATAARLIDRCIACPTGDD